MTLGWGWLLTKKGGNKKAASNTAERESKQRKNIYTTQEGGVSGRGNSDDKEELTVIEVMTQREPTEQMIEIVEKIKNDPHGADMGQWGEGYNWDSALILVIVELIEKLAKPNMQKADKL